MPAVLESYLAGRWTSPAGTPAPLLDASTGAEVALVASGEVDVGAAVRYAREVGGPALRALTFPERAALLREVAGVLTACKDELYELSAAAGATARDAAVDVDGAIGTVAVFASKGRKELPGGTVIAEDTFEPLGRGGTFGGAHLLTPLRGVAVQINAFNFPVWGPFEKLAPAVLAGVPSLVKPATPTAYVTERAIRRVIESGVLPEGALQLLCGSGRALLDELGGQDLVSFTGSATTAAALRRHDAVAGRSVRFNAEADSLNASVLGPDAVPGVAEFDLFVRQLVTEMTVKAGQKCTAIRRAIVPAAVVPALVEAVVARLATVVVGDPRDTGTRMGPVVGLDQREDVRAAAARIGAVSRMAFGSLDRVDAHGGDVVRGAFLSPLLFVSEDPDAGAPHEVEAFGPVSTVIPYDDPESVPELLGRGGGSLVASVVSADLDFVKRVVLDAAAFHGRVLVLDESSAAESTGHGTPMPQLVHGGPGRAGGGEEEGGLRAVRHHMQRTAVQGSPQVIEALRA